MNQARAGQNGMCQRHQHVITEGVSWCQVLGFLGHDEFGTCNIESAGIVTKQQA